MPGILLVALRVLMVVIAGAWATLASLYLRAAIALGRWPMPYADDPSALSFGVHYTLTGYAVALCGLATLATFVACIFGYLFRRRIDARHLRVPLLLAIGSTVSWILSPMVPWYLD
jgi:hypothetical protein